MCRCKTYCFLLFILCCAFKGYGQDETIFDLFRNDLQKGHHRFKKGSYAQSIMHFKKLWEKDSTDYFVNLYMARAHFKLKNFDQVVVHYRKVLNKNLFEKEDLIQFAEALQGLKEYKEAEYFYRQYLYQNPNNIIYAQRLSAIKAYSLFYEDSLCFDVSKLALNSDADDFAPVRFGNGIVFLSSRDNFSTVKKVNSFDNKPFLDLYFHDLLNENAQATIFDRKFNSSKHEGPVAFFENGSKMIYTVSKGATLHLYMAERAENNKTWRKTGPLPINSRSYSVSHPYFCEETSMLYFVSDMPGGYGGSDIYRCSFRAGKWGKPENLGPGINTLGNEMFPHVFSGSTILFSSNGHPGLGGLDIFLADLHGDEISQPINMGYPINSEFDDFGLFIDADGKSGYFSTNRDGSDDIWEFHDKKIRLHAWIYDGVTGKNIDDVEISLLSGNGEESLTRSGYEYSAIIKPGKNYTFNIRHNDYKTFIYSLDCPVDGKDTKIEVRLMLERKNKAFIKGLLKGDITPTSIELIDRTLDSTFTFVFDDKGEFITEIDADNDLVIFAQDSLQGYAAIVPVIVQKRSRGSAVSLFDIRLSSFSNIFQEVLLLDKNNNEPLGDAEVLVTETATGKRSFAKTDNSGRLTFSASSFSSYSLSIVCGDRSQVIVVPFNEQLSRIHLD